MPADEMTNLLRPALASGTGPDVFYSEVGIGFIGPLLKAGAIMDLTDVWKEKGWDEKLFSMAKTIPTAGGKTYGVGHELEFVPIYYNKNLFEQLGLTPPKTIAELEAICEKAKAAGLIPFAYAARDWWTQANFTTSTLWTYLSKEQIEEGMYHNGPWRFPEIEEAIQKVFVEWRDKGYYPASAEALSYDEGQMLFYQQKALMHPTGNWILNAYKQNITDFEVGSFLWPQAKEGVTPSTVAFCGSGYVISSATKHPEAAIAYVDYLMATAEAAKVWYEKALKIPPYKEPIADLNIDPLVQEGLSALFSGDVQLVPGFSMAVPPEVMTFLKSSAVMVLTNQLDAKGWLDEFERRYQKAEDEGITLGSFSW